MLVNGWRLFAHPLFTRQLERLVSQVGALAAQTPETFKNHPATKLLATIRRYILEIIPADPNAAEFRQGNTLGPDNRHWFRAKFHERYRLFYRFSSQDKVIIYAWVNDEGSLRKAGAKTDPYTIFQSMLASGDPPSSVAQLMNISKEMTEKRSGSRSSSNERKPTKGRPETG
ncbi:MAG: type II toxin-antitoxin system YhaV family toxin [Candidatus Acidiferrales bacterium]